LTNTWQTISDPLASAKPPSCCGSVFTGGTTIYGINDRRDLVGFFSDGVTANGLLATVPVSSTWAMMLAGFAALGIVGYRTSRKGVSVTA
jgi:hypothetical protein